MTPRVATAGPAADAGGPLLTIGELLARLAPEFPDVSHSKVRFLEDRGLVSPQRTPSGYRKFAPADVERLRAVLTLQRDRYLPLRVIRDHLDALDAGRTPPPLPGEPTGGAEQPEAAVPVQHSQSSQPVGRAAVLEAADGSAALVEALHDHGLLPRDSEGRYPASAVALVQAARDLGEHGIEPRHLRALRSAVGQEAALVEQVVSPLRRRASGERAQAVASELVETLLTLHAAALGCALADPPA